MNLNTIVDKINNLLAGDKLIYTELRHHLDSVIDDINSKLSSKFPTFSEFNNEEYPQYPNYDFFPDKYIRSVVALGVADKFYITDGEGATSSQNYSWAYKDKLFEMQRDYSNSIPEEYQDFEQGFMTTESVESNTILFSEQSLW